MTNDGDRAAGRRKPVIRDLLGLRFVSDPQLSPDGTTIAAVVTTIVTANGSADATLGGSSPDDQPGREAVATGAVIGAMVIDGTGSSEPANVPAPVDRGLTGDGASADDPPRYRSRIHLFSPPHDLTASTARNQGEPDWQGVSGDCGREFTQTAHRDSSPRFSPDGSRLAFLRAEEKRPPQLHVMALDGGEPVQLTHHEAGVGEFLWEPSGEAVVYVSRGEQVDDGEKGAGRRIKRLRYRADGEGFLPQAAADLYRVEAHGGSRRLTETPPEQAFGDPSSLAFAPDGKTLYFCRSGDEGSYDDFRSDLRALDLDTLATTVLLPGMLGLGGLAVVPGGDALSFTASSRQDDRASAAGVWLLQLTPDDEEPGPRLISGDLDVSPAEASDSRHGRLPNRPTWLTGDGSAAASPAAAGAASSPAYVGAAARLAVNLHRDGRSGLALLRGDGTLDEIHDAQESHRAVTGFAAHQSGSFAFVAESPVRPGELWWRSAEGEELRLSALNDEWCAGLELRMPSGPFALSRNGQAGSVPTGPLADDDVDYWTLSPSVARLDEAVVLEVHGGPHTAYGNGFMFEFQLLAARGYHVVYGNPRGSSSYGYHFATCMLGAYGSIDADDVLAIASDATERLGVREAPVHLTGGSYGGFMTNWLVGVSDRFRSAVSQRSISNWTSFYGTSDIGPQFVERELCGVPWQDVELLWRQSPLRNAAAIVTPLLLIHSEEDHRCPIEQAEQFFSAIKRQGTSEVELLRFPGEGHELSRSGRPDRRVQRLEAIIDWFESHA